MTDLLYYEDLEPSETFVEHDNRHTVTKEEIISFAKQYDPIPFHLSEEQASKWGHHTVTAPGTLTEAICVSLIHKNRTPIAAFGLLAKELTLPRPLYAGETVVLYSRMNSKRVSQNKPDRGVMEMCFQLKTTDGALVYDAKHIVIIKLRHPKD